MKEINEDIKQSRPESDQHTIEMLNRVCSSTDKFYNNLEDLKDSKLYFRQLLEQKKFKRIVGGEDLKLLIQEMREIGVTLDVMKQVSENVIIEVKARSLNYERLKVHDDVQNLELDE